MKDIYSYSMLISYISYIITTYRYRFIKDNNSEKENKSNILVFLESLGIFVLMILPVINIVFAILCIYSLFLPKRKYIKLINR